MSEVVEPVHVCPAVIEGMNELMCDHPGHMGLLVDVVLTQNDLGGSCIKATADHPVTVLTGKMSVFKHLAP